MKKNIKIINAILYSIATIMMFIPFMFKLCRYDKPSYDFYDSNFNLSYFERINAITLIHNQYEKEELYTFSKNLSFLILSKFLCIILLLCLITSIVLYIMSLNKEFKKHLLFTLSGVTFMIFFIFDLYISTVSDGQNDPLEYDYYLTFKNTTGAYIVLIILLIALALSVVITFSKESLLKTLYMHKNPQQNIQQNPQQYVQQNPQQYMQQNMAPLENTNTNFTPTNEPDNFEIINKYKNLLDQGIITQEEFDKKKKELLDL